MSLILAIDQSTSATKAILFDGVGRVLDKTARDHRQIYPQSGWVEHDPDEIWANVLAAVEELISRNSGCGGDLAALGIANQRETILVWDRATGRPLHNAIVWQDRRGDFICQKLKAKGHEDLVRRKTGLKIDTYFSASKLAWLMTERPEIAAGIREGGGVIGTMDSYLIHRLTAGEIFATDCTNASRTLLFDIRTLRWDEELCELFAVPFEALPEVRESASHFGETTVSGILPKQVPIIGVIGDSQASLFAQGCHEPGAAKATFGTGTSLLLNIGGEFKLPPTGLVTALASVWQGRPTYAMEGLINFSAATIEWLKSQLNLIRDASEVEALALAVVDNGGVYFVPAFSGLSAPCWAPAARGAIVGMTPFTRREHVVRAALEAIAYQIRDVLDMMRADSGIALQRLQADGGATCNAFLMQFTADITGVELHVADIAESSARGAAMNGLLGLGVFTSPDDFAALPRQCRIFKPRMYPVTARQLHDGWLAAVRKVLQT